MSIFRRYCTAIVAVIFVSLAMPSSIALAKKTGKLTSEQKKDFKAKKKRITGELKQAIKDRKANLSLVAKSDRAQKKVEKEITSAEAKKTKIDLQTNAQVILNSKSAPKLLAAQDKHNKYLDALKNRLNSLKDSQKNDVAKFVAADKTIRDKRGELAVRKADKAQALADSLAAAIAKKAAKKAAKNNAGNANVIYDAFIPLNASVAPNGAVIYSSLSSAINQSPKPANNVDILGFSIPPFVRRQ
jgi:hypothetical protein